MPLPAQVRSPLPPSFPPTAQVLPLEGPETGVCALQGANAINLLQEAVCRAMNVHIARLSQACLLFLPTHASLPSEWFTASLQAMHAVCNGRLISAIRHICDTERLNSG